MSTVFNKQIEHYTKKFNETLGRLRSADITDLYEKKGIFNLSEAIVTNEDAFRLATYKIASTLMPGVVSCTTYAAVCARVAEEFGISYTVMAGFCLKDSHPTKNKDLAYYEEQKSKGIEHPMMATHVYLDIKGVFYEYYSGDTSGINHIDCIVIAEG